MIKMNNTNISISDAILSLRPNAEFSIFGNSYNDIEWYSQDVTKPTMQEVDAAIVQLQAEFDAKDYQRKRAEAYPSIQDQLDTLYHGGFEDWKASIQAIKDQFPK